MSEVGARAVEGSNSASRAVVYISENGDAPNVHLWSLAGNGHRLGLLFLRFENAGAVDQHFVTRRISAGEDRVLCAQIAKRLAQ